MCCGRLRCTLHQSSPATPHIPSSGIKLASPCSPINCPRLKAPYFPPDPASAIVSIDSWFSAISPDQNAGQLECTIGQPSCMDNCELVEITISARNTLHKPRPTITRLHDGVTRPHVTANPTLNSGMQAPA